MAYFLCFGRQKFRFMNYKLAKLYDADNDLSRQWFVYFYFKHPENGKFVRFRKWISNRIRTKSGRRDVAHAIIKSFNIKLQRGWSPFAEEETRLTSIEQAFNHAINIKSASIGKRAVQTYRSISGKFIMYLQKNKLNNVSIGDISHKIIQDFFDQSIIKEKISPRTFNNRITALKTIFNWLIRRDYLLFNPADRIERMPEPDPELTAFTESELRMISGELPGWDYNLYVISQLIFYCFLRPAEIVRLQFKDVVREKSLIMVPGTKSKNKKTETIIMPDQLMINIREWNLGFPQNWYLFSKNLCPGQKEIAPTRIAEAWKRFAEANGIIKGIYSLKHTGKGMAFDQGFNPRDIQLQNRHYSLEQTQQYLNRFRRVAGEKFQKEFKGF